MLRPKTSYPMHKEQLTQKTPYKTPVADLFTLEAEETLAKSNVEQIIDDDDEEDLDW